MGGLIPQPLRHRQRCEVARGREDRRGFIQEVRDGFLCAAVQGVITGRRSRSSCLKRSAG